MSYNQVIAKILDSTEATPSDVLALATPGWATTGENQMQEAVKANQGQGRGYAGVRSLEQEVQDVGGVN